MDNIFPYFLILLRKIHYLHNYHGMIQEFHLLLFDCNRNKGLNLFCMYHIDYQYRFQDLNNLRNFYDKVSISILLLYLLLEFYLNI